MIDDDEERRGDVSKRKLSENSQDEKDETALIREEAKREKQWDCESVLSTYSTIYNRPKLIVEPSKPKVTCKGGLNFLHLILRPYPCLISCLI